MPDAALPGALAREVARVADRLRNLSLVRLAEPVAGHASRADAARGLAQSLADAAAHLEGGPHRKVPRLPDAAVGDQVAVTGADLVDAGRAAPSGTTPVLEQALRELVDLRRLI